MTDAVERLVNDTEPKLATFTFAGEEFVVRRVDLRVLGAAERGRVGKALELMIGRDQMDRLISIDSDEELTEATVMAAMRAWATANGTTQGESTASTDS